MWKAHKKGKNMELKEIEAKLKKLYAQKDKLEDKHKKVISALKEKIQEEENDFAKLMAGLQNEIDPFEKTKAKIAELQRRMEAEMMKLDSDKKEEKVEEPAPEPQENNYWNE